MALLVSIYLIILLRSAMGGGATTGANILYITSVLALALCIYSGVNRTSDCLASEKRGDTLGLLFLTHLKGHDIVLGKLFASSLHAAFILVAVLPILAIPVFLGGVSGSELVRIPFALLNSLFLAVSLGILVSAMARSQRAAHLASGSLITVLVVVLPIAAHLVQRFSSFPSLAIPLSIPSPTYALQMSFDSTLGLSTNLFWTALGIQFSIAVASVFSACWIVPRSWQIKAGDPGKFRALFERWNYGPEAFRAVRRFHMLNRNPIFWLNFRPRFEPFIPALFALGSMALAFGCIRYFEIPDEPAFVIALIMLGLNDFAMRIRVGALASLRLGQDRQSGALEMILSTPLTVREILRGEWMAIRAKLLWTYIPLLTISAIAAHLVVFTVGGHLIVIWFFLLMSVGDFIAMGYVAMWKGMRVRNVQQAAGAALLRVLIFPWCAWGLLMSLSFFQEIFREFGEWGFFIAAVLVWVLSTVTAIRSARRKLLAHFREAATDRYNFEQRTSLFTLARKWSDTFLTLNLLRPRPPRVVN